MPDLITNDVANFWRAFEAAEGMAEQNQVRIYEDLYLNRGSRGFREFADAHLPDARGFADFAKGYDAFYRSVRFQTHRIREFEGEIRHFYRRFGKLYPALTIPNVYFIIGTLSMRTHVAESGILVGSELFGLGEHTSHEALSRVQRAELRAMASLPDALIHELARVQQDVPKPPTSLLEKAVREGAAVLITELVTGRRDESAPHIFGDTNESRVWAAFKHEMYGRDYDRWLGGEMNLEGWPQNLGAYVGCQICRAFLEGGRRREMIRALVEAEAFEEVYERSGYEVKAKGKM